MTDELLRTAIKIENAAETGQWNPVVVAFRIEKSDVYDDFKTWIATRDDLLVHQFAHASQGGSFYHTMGTIFAKNEETAVLMKMRWGGEFSDLTVIG